MARDLKQKVYSVEEIRKTYAKAYAPWTKEEDELLKKAYQNFLQFKKLLVHTDEIFYADYSQRLGRKIGGIRSRIAKLLNIHPELVSGSISNRCRVKPGMTRKVPDDNGGKSNIKIDLNPEFQKALDLMENTNKNLFLTGRAGTGKSTLLTHFRNFTKKKVVVLAPTGVAALNVHGQTIHSFFKFKPNITLKNVKKLYKKDNPKNIYAKIDTIVIDEISMVRSDLLDCVDKFLQLNRFSSLPFGGVQMILIGDLYQLPPVVTGSEREIFKTHYASQYFFDAKVFEKLQIEFVELEKVYRQKDDEFINLLNAIRNNSATEEHLEQLNKKYDPNFEPKPQSFTKTYFYGLANS